MLVAVALLGIIVSSVGAIIVQTMTVSASNNHRMEAIKQVENALHWIDRDAQQALPGLIAHGSNVFTGSGLLLQWKQYESTGTLEHRVRYYFDGNFMFMRSEQINGGTAAISRIAEYLDSNLTRYTFDGETLQVDFAAIVPGFKPATESRTLYVIPRIQ